MSKSHQRPRRGASARPGKTAPPRKSKWPVALVVLIVISTAAAVVWNNSQRPPATTAAKPTTAAPVTNAVPSLYSFRPQLLADSNLTSMEVAHSVMDTVLLDFGGPPPSPAVALQQIERQYAPLEGTERTFAIIEAFGQTNAEGKLQLSMKISTEKPGAGALVFRRTGETLWKSRFVASGPPKTDIQLTVMMEDGVGGAFPVDGSKNPVRILDSVIHNNPLLIRDYWPDKEERTMSFIYSACGCPVKTKVRRVGETTQRVNEWPVMFPDDPDALRVINALMGWPAKTP